MGSVKAVCDDGASGEIFIIFLQPMEVYIDDEAKLTLHGLRQHYVKLKDSEKNRKLFELLDVLEFNQVGDSWSPWHIYLLNDELHQLNI